MMNFTLITKNGSNFISYLGWSPWEAPMSNPPKLSRKSATAMRATAELHLALNCPNEVAFINTIRSSSTINFPYPLELKRYYYRIYLVENPCVMTKPKNYYLQPSIKRQLCIDVAWFLSHHGLVPMLVMIVHYSNYYR